MKFKIGDTIWGNGWTEERYPEEYRKGWKKGKITRYTPGDTTMLRDESGVEWCVYSDSLNFVAMPILRGTPVRQRCGRPAVILEHSNDGISARVQMPIGPDRVLSYSATGYFYKSIESDVDLVPVAGT